MISKLINKINVLMLIFVLFMGTSPLAALMGSRDREKTNEEQKPKQEEYKGRGSRAYNQAHPLNQNKANTIKRNPVNDQALKRDLNNPEVVPVAPGTAAEVQQEQILQNQELMMQQLTPQQNTNSNSQQQ